MKYPGSKWGSADWIISHFPEHHSYLEPFFGSGGVFFNKPRSDIETINDLDGEVVNLFRQIRNVWPAKYTSHHIHGKPTKWHTRKNRKTTLKKQFCFTHA